MKPPNEAQQYMRPNSAVISDESRHCIFLEKVFFWSEKTCSDRMDHILEDYPKLRVVLYDLLFTGKPIPYTAMNDYIEIAAMFSFIRNEKGTAVIHNRIFETVLYNWFMSDEYMDSKLYDAGLQGKSQFIIGGHLNVRRILERFVESFDDPGVVMHIMSAESSS